LILAPLYYSALVQTLERSKKKYQSRQKKLEQQMLGMMERHSALVSTFCFLVFNPVIHETMREIELEILVR
jgi:hypothetical protein